ncbi:MAG TPA: hypothetical protein VEI57_16015 [Nitrospirota bacterium]|nr:hypothetical protein [Nitrospirota bacterium]
MIENAEFEYIGYCIKATVSVGASLWQPVLATLWKIYQAPPIFY